MGGEGGPASGKSLARYCRQQVFLQCLTHGPVSPPNVAQEPLDIVVLQTTSALHAVPDACQ